MLRQKRFFFLVVTIGNPSVIQKYGMFVHVAREQETIEGVMESNWFKVQTNRSFGISF